MDRIKGRIDSSTPIRSDVAKFYSDDLQPPSDIESSPKEAKVKKQTYLEMVFEAINTMGVPKKGASYQAIKKWITDNKEIDKQHLKAALKIAIRKGMDKGILVRPKKSEKAVGATGFFMLAPEKPTSKAFKKLQVKKSLEKAGRKKMKDEKIPSKEKSEAEKNLAIKAPSKGKTEAKKIPAKKAPSKEKAEVEKNLKMKAPSKEKAEVEKNLKMKAPSKEKAEVEKNLKMKAPSKEKAEVEKNLKMKAPSKEKAEVEKNLKMKAPSKEKAELEKNPATKTASQVKTERKPIANPPSNAKAEKITVKAPPKAENKPAVKVPSKAKAQKLHKEDFLDDVFDNSDIDEDPGNAEMISEVVKKEKANTKYKAEKNETVKSKVGDSVKDKRGMVAKAMKKLPKNDAAYVKQAKAEQNNVKRVGNKKLNTSENELSDSGWTIRKNKMFYRTFSSDTELEVSKREEEKKTKKAPKVKKGAET